MSDPTSITAFTAPIQYVSRESSELNPTPSKETSGQAIGPPIISLVEDSADLPASLTMKLELVKELRGNNTKQIEKFVKQTASDINNGRSPSQALTLSDEWQIPLRAAMDELPELTTDKEKTSTGFSHHWQLSIESMEKITVNYLEPYEYAVPKFTSFWSAVADFISKLTGYYEVKTDKNGLQTITFKDTFAKDLNALIQKYKNGPEGVLYPESGTVSKAEAELWATRLGMDASCVQAQGGGYVVRVDIKPLEAISASATTNEMAMVQFDSWNIGFNLQKDKYQTAAQALTSKYGSATQIFDNQFRTRSTSITADAELLSRINSFN